MLKANQDNSSNLFLLPLIRMKGNTHENAQSLFHFDFKVVNFTLMLLKYQACTSIWCASNTTENFNEKFLSHQ